MALDQRGFVVDVRIWPFNGPTHQPGQDVRALLTLNALGPSQDRPTPKREP